MKDKTNSDNKITFVQQRRNGNDQQPHPDLIRESSEAYDYRHAVPKDEEEAARQILLEAAAPLSEFLKQGRYTVADYEKLPEDRRFELIDGYLVELFSPAAIHQVILLELAVQINACIEKAGVNCQTFIAPCDVQLNRDEKTMVQPDVFVACGDERFLYRMIKGAPKFAIEILSPSTRSYDMVLKRYKYRRAGVEEFWLVDPKNRSVLVCPFAMLQESEEASGPHKDAELQYSFESQIPIGISDGRCVIDFEKIDRKIAPFL